MTEIPNLVEEFTAKNKDLTGWTDRVFIALCKDERLRWLFFNTLSYMEHIGSYKIMATQQGNVIDYPTLKHLNEETGHAVLFKRHAERFKGTGLDYSEPVLIAPASARAYFGRLEASMVSYFGRDANYRTIYLYMSLIVEFRAVWGYEILQDCIERSQLDFSLAKLLAEEQGHLNSMVRRLDEDGLFSKAHVEFFWRRERMLYIRLMKAIERQLDRNTFRQTVVAPTDSAALAPA